MRFSTFLIIWLTVVIATMLVTSLAFANLTVKVDNTGHLVYYLHKQVDLNNSIYQPLFDRLDSAKKGEIINIVIINNAGGAVVTMDMIETRIKRSKAFVKIHIKGYAASAAAHLSLVGDAAYIDYDSNLLWHTGSICFGPGLCIRVTKDLGKMLPDWGHYYSETVERERWIYDPVYWCWGPLMCMKSPFSSTYVSEEYWKVYKTGMDKWVSGKEVCERKGGFVKYHSSGARYCVLAGMKRW